MWQCCARGVRPGHAFQLLLQTTAPQAAISAVDSVSPAASTGFRGNPSRMSPVQEYMTYQMMFRILFFFEALTLHCFIVKSLKYYFMHISNLLTQCKYC